MEVFNPSFLTLKNYNFPSNLNGYSFFFSFFLPSKSFPFHNDYCVYNSGYLFEGHLTVDREPPQPQWLVQSNLLSAAASMLTAESSHAAAESDNTSENATNLLQSLIDNLDTVLPPVFPCSFS